MLQIQWQPEALQSLDDIAVYIGQFSLASADELVDHIESAVNQLPLYPYLYRVGRVDGTREMVVHPNYIVVYRVELDCIRIARVLHSRQQYPTLSKTSTASYTTK
jgi:toxin ParE1/3/4